MPFPITQGLGTDGSASANLMVTGGFGSAGYTSLLVLGITATSTYIDLEFTQDLAPLTAQAADKQFWTLSGPVAVDVTAVEKISNKVVRLSITEPKGGELYDLNMPDTGLFNTGGDPYVGGDPLSFTAVAESPIAFSAQALDSRRVRVIFSEPVLSTEALDKTNYSVAPSLAISSVTQENSRTYVLTTGPQTAGVEYTITIVNVRDRSENPV